MPRGETRERELGRQDFSIVRDISQDGKLIVFVEQGEASDSGIYLRKTDGTPAIRLGDASGASDISSDGRWVLCVRNGPPPELVLLPTGPGTPKRFPLEAPSNGQGLLPNGKGILVSYRNKAGKEGTYLIGPDGGKPKLLPDIGGALLTSEDGNHVLYEIENGQLKIAPISGGDSASVPGPALDRNDELVLWSADGRFLYVWRKGDVPARIDRLDLATGRREPWKQLMPEDPTGVTNIDPVVFARDGQSYAYSYVRILVSDLYVVEGVK